MTFPSQEISPELGQAIRDGVCLINNTGRIIAADAAVIVDLEALDPAGVLLATLVGEGIADQALERLEAGEEQFTMSSFHFQKVHGSSGVSALVTFRSNPMPETLDALTGLPDRRAVVDRVASWGRSNGKSSPRFAVLFVDLDDFKQVNDLHGHAVGDKFLAIVAERLVHCVREGDLVARYGGDEFVILLRDIEDFAEAELITERLQDCAAAPVDLGGLQLCLAVTIGVAIAANADCSVEALIDAADQDMYKRKRRPNKVR